MNDYVPCKELDECNRLIEEYFKKGSYKECFDGHLKLAECGYPLAECQVGYFYHEGLGAEKNFEKAFFWTKRAAEHGDSDAQCNLAEFYLEGTGTKKDEAKAKEWFAEAARQGNEYAREKLEALANGKLRRKEE